MGWSIVLESEGKVEISLIKTEFHIKKIEKLKELKLLRYLDPFEDTTFNRLQMPELIEDLQILKKYENNSLINEILNLAERCKNEQHYYITFYGD